VALIGGVRGGRVRLSASDAFLSNGDDSGERSFSYTNPVLGARWGIAPGLNVHASAARGYEAPTLGDIAYRPTGGAGLNFVLLPQRSEQAELGLKWRQAQVQLDVALFEARVKDEISVFSNSGGRATFQNVGRTLRRGAELAGRWQPGAGFSAVLSATWLDATYRDPFLACTGVGCTTPTVPVPVGNRIAGTQRSNGYAEVAWRHEALGEYALELRGAGETFVNDINSDRAAGYGLVNLRWRQRLPFSPLGQAELLLRVDNAADRRYAGSVIVNEGNQRFFEPGAPRTYLVALRLLFP
jgi:iron complex outermembrane receptor protein